MRLSEHRSTILTKLLQVICACILSGILVAGLWPFSAPRNEVTWSDQGYGLHFGKHGSILSSGTFEVAWPEDESACSLEIWLQPSQIQGFSTILAFYRPANNVVPFVLGQSLGDLVLQRAAPRRSTKPVRIYVDGVFNDLKPIFLTITSGVAGTAVYTNGILEKRTSIFTFSDADLTGQLILGNMPSTNHSWAGQVDGLAVYDHELAASEVSRHFAEWTKGTQPDLATAKGVVAAYLFNEGKGDIVHNEINSATDLLIPKRFFVLQERFLECPWNAYRPGWKYWKDVFANIAGFIPLGFFFCMYFSLVRKMTRAAIVTIALGFSVSLTIEGLQTFLPTRNSDMTDIITNTLGTVLGVILCLYIPLWQRLMSCAWNTSPHE